MGKVFEDVYVNERGTMRMCLSMSFGVGGGAMGGSIRRTLLHRGFIESS
jgi:hypothetical protein